MVGVAVIAVDGADVPLTLVAVTVTDTVPPSARVAEVPPTGRPGPPRSIAGPAGAAEGDLEGDPGEEQVNDAVADETGAGHILQRLAVGGPRCGVFDVRSGGGHAFPLTVRKLSQTWLAGHLEADRVTGDAVE